MIFSPLEQFEIKKYINIVLPFDINLYFTNSALYILIAILIIISIYKINKNELLINKKNILSISLFYTLINILIDQIGNKAEKYFPFVFTIFNFILVINLLGLIPYSFTSTSHFIFTLSISMAILIATIIIGIKEHKLAFLSIFIPSGTPLVLIPLLIIIELISYITKGLSLGIRLAANMIGGHILLNILSSFIYKFFNMSIFYKVIGIFSIILFTLLLGLELTIAILQAYVFTILTIIYIKDSIILH